MFFPECGVLMKSGNKFPGSQVRRSEVSHPPPLNLHIQSVTKGAVRQKVTAFFQRRTWTLRFPAVVSGVTVFRGGTRPVAGGIWVDAAPRLGFVAVATVDLRAALFAAAVPAGAGAFTTVPVNHSHGLPFKMFYIYFYCWWETQTILNHEQLSTGMFH